MQPRWAALGALLLLLGVATAALAETAWVRGAPLNLRSGPGTQFRIIGTAKPGDPVNVLERMESWTKVRKGDNTGWIAAGYLDPQPPPTQRLEQLEAETTRLQEQLASTGNEADRLRESNAEISGQDESQKAEIARLTQENFKLRAGERYAEWITGALILGLGMSLGALLRGISGRNRSNRLRL